MCDETFRVFRTPARLKCAAEDKEVLMAVDLPDHLVVANQVGIQIRNPAPVNKGCVLSGDGIKMPVDGESERQPFVAQ